VAHGPRKKPLDFGGNPDHVTLGLEQIGVTVLLWLRLDGAPPYSAWEDVPVAFV